MGKGGGGGDPMDWPTKNEYTFLQILYDRVKSKQMQTNSFKQTQWEEINEELFQQIGEKYGVDKLRGKFNRLRKKHREFSDLLKHTGVTWNSASNIVFAPEDVWQSFYKKSKSYKQFRKKGCEHYELLGEIFNNSTATGQFHHASTEQPPTSDEERQLENEFLSTGVHVENQINVEEVDTSSMDNSSKRRSSNVPGERRVKMSKSSQIESCLEVWTQSLVARTEATKSKTEARKLRAEKFKAQSSSTATSPVSDPYSIGVCMDILENMIDIPTKCYNKAVEKFTSADWRQIFVKMSDVRKRGWVDSLG